MIIIDNETNKKVTKKYLQSLLLEFEIDDILENWNDYKCEFLNIYTQCEKIKKIEKMDIKKIIWHLNTFWGCNFEIKEN